MTGVHDFIVQIEKVLNDRVTHGSLELYIDPSFHQTANSNRVGKVISVPSDYQGAIEPGFQVVVIPTILLKQSYKGVSHDSVFLVDKDKGYFRVPDDLVVMYRASDSDQWQCYGEYLMIEPVKIDQEQKKIGSIIIPDVAYKSDVETNMDGYEKQKGRAYFLNEELTYNGVEKGDMIYFKDHGSYEFKIDDRVLYCMDNQDVLAKLYE